VLIVCRVHYVQEVMSDGKVIQLDDGSLWQVSAVDTVGSIL